MIACCLRYGDRVFETYWTTGQATEAMESVYGLLDVTLYGRRETVEHSPPGWPQFWRNTGDQWYVNGRPTPVGAASVATGAIATENRRMADAQDPMAVVTAGSVIVGTVLLPAGFTFQPTGAGHSSGGAFAAGRFIKHSQYLQFHFRHSLGLIVYGWGEATLCHADYLRGLGTTGAYPGYSTDPLDGFRHLALDLAGPLCGFRDGDRSGYDRARRAAADGPRRKLP